MLRRLLLSQENQNWNQKEGITWRKQWKYQRQVNFKKNSKKKSMSCCVSSFRVSSKIRLKSPNPFYLRCVSLQKISMYLHTHLLFHVSFIKQGNKSRRRMLLLTEGPEPMWSPHSSNRFPIRSHRHPALITGLAWHAKLASMNFFLALDFLCWKNIGQFYGV